MATALVTGEVGMILLVGQEACFCWHKQDDAVETTQVCRLNWNVGVVTWALSVLLIDKACFGWHQGLNWRNVAFGIFNGLVFASAGPIIDIKLVTGINWTTFQHTRPNQWAKHWQRSLDTANLLDSVSIVKPCCTSRKAETINSPLSAKDTWLLLASSHRALFGS